MPAMSAYTEPRIQVSRKPGRVEARSTRWEVSLLDRHRKSGAAAIDPLQYVFFFIYPVSASSKVTNFMPQALWGYRYVGPNDLSLTGLGPNTRILWALIRAWFFLKLNWLNDIRVFQAVDRFVSFLFCFSFLFLFSGWQRWRREQTWSAFCYVTKSTHLSNGWDWIFRDCFMLRDKKTLLTCKDTENQYNWKFAQCRSAKLFSC